MGMDGSCGSNSVTQILVGKLANPLEYPVLHSELCHHVLVFSSPWPIPEAAGTRCTSHGIHTRTSHHYLGRGEETQGWQLKELQDANLFDLFLEMKNLSNLNP